MESSEIFLSTGTKNQKNYYNMKTNFAQQLVLATILVFIFGLLYSVWGQGVETIQGFTVQQLAGAGLGGGGLALSIMWMWLNNEKKDKERILKINDQLRREKTELYERLLEIEKKPILNGKGERAMRQIEDIHRVVYEKR